MNIVELQDKLTKLNINMLDIDICKIWGMDAASFSRKKKMGTEIKYRNIQQLENALKVDLIDKNYANNLINDRIKELQNNLGIDSGNNTVLLPYRPDVYLSAGYGVEVYSESAEFITLDSRLFMTDRGNKINPAHCEVVRISGSSMEPEYRHGDRVIIDRDDTEFLDGHIFAFRYKGQCYVKEINVIGDKIKCISLNKEYEPFYIKQGEEFTVFGRILPRIRL